MKFLNIALSLRFSPFGFIYAEMRFETDIACKGQRVPYKDDKRKYCRNWMGLKSALHLIKFTLVSIISRTKRKETACFFSAKM
jgi:hypothetical protein